MEEHSTHLRDIPQPLPDTLAALHQFVQALARLRSAPRQALESGLTQLANALDWERLELRVEGDEATEDLLIVVHAGPGRGLVTGSGSISASVGGPGLPRGSLRLEGTKPADRGRDQPVLQVLAELLAEPMRQLRCETSYGSPPGPRPAANANGAQGSLKGLMDALEREILVKAMVQAGGVQSRAARSLQTTPRILAYRLRRHGLHEELARPHGSTSSSRPA